MNKLELTSAMAKKLNVSFRIAGTFLDIYTFLYLIKIVYYVIDPLKMEVNMEVVLIIVSIFHFANPKRLLKNIWNNLFCIYRISD